MEVARRFGGITVLATTRGDFVRGPVKLNLPVSDRSKKPIFAGLETQKKIVFFDLSAHSFMRLCEIRSIKYYAYYYGTPKIALSDIAPSHFLWGRQGFLLAGPTAPRNARF